MLVNGNTKRCRFDGCERDPGTRKDICGMHYFRIRQGTPLDQPPVERFGDKGCAVEGCLRPRLGKHCAMHRTRLLRHGDADAVLPRAKLQGTANPNWKSQGETYDTIHKRHPTADHCTECGANEPARRRYQWALNWHGEPHARCDVQGNRMPYSVRAEDYIQLCVGCHKTMDMNVVIRIFGGKGKRK